MNQNDYKKLSTETSPTHICNFFPSAALTYLKAKKMESFLHTVAQRIWDEHQHDIEHITVVFNNRRAGLFLKKELRTFGDKPFFLPDIIGIDDLVATLGQKQITPHEFLLFELYDIHRNIEGVGRRFDTFEEFISFGEMMLADFSEIDLYCVDAKKLFSHIKDYKRLGEWDVTGAPLTPFQEKYLKFYESLNTYYTQLRANLDKEQKAYTGMAYRYVAENIDTLASRLECSHVYFVGFNALSASEYRIISHFVRQGLGTLLCDGDTYYFDDDRQEAGHFLRENKKRFEGTGAFDDHFSLEDKTIHIINCPENVLQAKACGKIVDQLEKSSDTTLQDTAIVLADENMLLPVLNSLPQQVKSTNVTMGYPFTLSNVNALATKLMALYANARDDKFYHVDLTNVLSDTLVAKFLETNDMYARITGFINRQKVIRARKQDISLMLNGIDKSDQIMFLFEKTTPAIDEIIDLMRQLFALLVDADLFDGNTKEKESLACLLQILNYLNDLQVKRNFITRIDTLQKIYQRIAQRRSVPFYGEPLEGLQILGMLETRSLDFSNIILLSLNEGTLPAGRSTNSLIPLSLKTAYGIPAFKEKDAVYAYNFYRLIQRAHNVWLLYSSDSDGMGKGEPSRFILQIRNELAPRYPNIKISEEIVAATNKASSTEKGLPVGKDSRTLQRLGELAQKGFSPSALNRYRGCPKQFFYGDVLHIQEREEMNEDLEANELGSYIHDLLKQIYLRDTDHIIKIGTLQDALDNIGTMVDESFKREVLKGRSEEGKNRLYNEVAKTQISHFLKKEIESLKKGNRIEISLLEEDMTMPLTLGDNSASVNIKGVADRVDLFNGQLRIADYKSGRVKNTDLAVKDEQFDPHAVPDKWFQVMTYAWLYCRKHNYAGPFTAGIFALGALSSDFMAVRWTGTSELCDKHIDLFEQHLATLLDEIMDPGTDFFARPDSYRCKYCPFARICDSKKAK